MRSMKPQHRMPGVVYQSPDQLERYIAAGVLTEDTMAGSFREIARRFPDRTALSDVGWSCSYRELDELTDRAGAALLGLGMASLDRVIFQAANCKELVIAALACFKANLIPVCTLAAHRRVEIGYLGQHAAATAHLVQGDDPKFDFVAFSREMRGEIPTLRHTVVLRGPAPDAEGVHSFDAMIESQELGAARAALAAVEIDPFQVALFQLSGGTTGVPKIIPRFQNEYVYTIRTMIEFQGFDETLVAFSVNPMMHNAPMACFWGPALLCGGEIATCANVDPSVLGPFLARRKPNWMLVPVPILLRLREAGWLDRLDYSGVRGFSVMNGPAKYSAMVGNSPTYPIFGMTEGLLCYCNPSDPDEARLETAGRPLSDHDEVVLLDPGSEARAPEGEIGELAVRGPCTIRGYYDAVDRNAVAFTSDGFYRSGDLIRFRVVAGRRYLVFEGRVKDVVDRGGEKINSEEVERVCVGHPAIMAMAVVAMPDPVYGQRACAFVIPAHGTVAPTVKELGAFLEREGLAKFKWPERIEVVSEFPLTSSGKLSKPKLREWLDERMRAGARELA